MDSPSASPKSATSTLLELLAEPRMVRTAVSSHCAPDGLMMTPLRANALWGARCGKSARRVLTGGTSPRSHAGSVRSPVRKRRLRQGSAKATASRLVSTGHSVVREQLMAMIERRVGDGSILRLIRKWIHVGVIEDGRLLVSERGTGQGQVISPLLSNIYLHVVLDEWFENEVKPRLKGKAFEVRYADDGLLCFQYREDAERVLQVLHKRFAKFGLTLHPEKTCLIEFGRSAHAQGRRTGVKPATFDFLGFTHISATSLRGKFTIHLKTMKKRLRRALKAAAVWCQDHRHDELAHQWMILTAKLRVHYQYYGRPTNYRSLWQFYRIVRRLWRKWLNRRTRGKTLTWADYARILEGYPLPRPKITRAWLPTR